MSGGKFDYLQYKMGETADQIESMLEDYKKEYSQMTVNKFEKTVRCLRWAAIALHRTDWLLSGDDGEEVFHKRWEEDFHKLWEDRQLCTPSE